MCLNGCVVILEMFHRQYQLSTQSNQVQKLQKTLAVWNVRSHTHCSTSRSCIKSNRTNLSCPFSLSGLVWLKSKLGFDHLHKQKHYLFNFGTAIDLHGLPWQSQNFVQQFAKQKPSSLMPSGKSIRRQPVRNFQCYTSFHLPWLQGHRKHSESTIPLVTGAVQPDPLEVNIPKCCTKWQGLVSEFGMPQL